MSDRFLINSRVLRAAALSLKPVPWMVVAGLSSVYRWDSFGSFGFAGFAMGFEAALRDDFRLAVAVDLATFGIVVVWQKIKCA